MNTIRYALLVSTALLMILVCTAQARENAWTSHGPTDVGIVSDVAIAGSAAWAATANGVFRSTDGGATWQPSGLAGEWILQILAPSSGAAILANTSAGKLYASRDGGASWAALLGIPAVIRAAIDSARPSTFYAGGEDGAIWKSTDAGSTWRRVSTTPGYGPVAFAFDSDGVYVAVTDRYDGRSRLYRSSAGGIGWTPLTTPETNLTTLTTGASAGLIYAGGSEGLCRSTDSAATWTCSGVSGSTTRILELPASNDGAPARILVAGQLGLYVSGDGGATQTRVFGSNFTDLESLASDATGSLLLASGGLGILRSQDGGQSWTSASVGLRSAFVNQVALDPQNPATVWASGWGTDGTRFGLFRSADAGVSWSLSSGPATWLSFLAVDPHHPSTLYGAGSTSADWAVYRSADGGALWTSAALPGKAQISALAADPVSPERVWAASFGGLFRSDDGAQTWMSPPAVAQEVYSILFDGKRPGTIYAGSYFDYVEGGYYPGPEGGSIFMSRDSGASWTKSAQDIGDLPVTIAADPFRDGVLYVGNLGVSRTADYGQSWQNRSLGLPQFGVVSIVADPVRSGYLYCLTGDGTVSRTINDAQVWHPLSGGLGPYRAQALVISPDGRWLHVGTVGGGVFELDLAAAAPTSPCVASATRLCLVGNRYAVDLLAGQAGQLLNNPGAARPLGDRAGYFGLPFATGEPDLPEVVVKMLPEGAFGGGGAPVFYSSLTTLPYLLTVTDTATGRIEDYVSNLDTPLCGGTDLPFGSVEAASLRRTESASAGETVLRLLNGRFSVTLEARVPHGIVAAGRVMASLDQAGFFSLPDVTGDPGFPEVVVKMIDARSFAGEFWFFQTGLTSLDYTLTVTDSETGAVNTYDSAGPFCGAADTHAFTN